MGLLAMLPIIVRRVGDPDYWWHELTGRIMWQHAALARTELYTFTVQGTPWTDQEYLSQLLIHALQSAGGLLLVSLAFSALIWAGFWLILARTRQRAYSPFVAGAALLLAAGAGFAVWGPRPQMFDFVFISVELYWIERFVDQRSRAVYALPLLTLLWANLHGGFVFCYLFLAVTLLGLALRRIADRSDAAPSRQLRQLLLVGAGCVVAGLLTPNGPALFAYVWRTQFSFQLDFVAEWASPDFHKATLLPLEALIFALLVGFVWQRPRVHDVLLVIAGMALALHSVRFIPILVTAATPVLIWQWTAGWSRLRDRVQRSEWPARERGWAGEALLMGLVAVAAGAAALAALTLHGQARATEANYPVGAADWLGSHPAVGTRLFNEYSWGGYIAYRFYPTSTRRVFIYGEAELMGDALLASYADVNQLKPDWQHVLDEHRVDYVVFPTGRPLDAALTTSPRWRRVFEDSVASIYIRTPGLPPQ